MSFTQFLVVAACLIPIAVLLLLKTTKDIKQLSKLEKPHIRQILTKREQPMFFRLIETFPNHLVLAQVAFSSLITSKSRATRNTFDKKVADFVLCTKSFQPVAVIELDDASHKGMETKDALRANLLTSAGIKVIRYRHVPDAALLKVEIDALSVQPAKSI